MSGHFDNLSYFDFVFASRFLKQYTKQLEDDYLTASSMDKEVYAVCIEFLKNTYETIDMGIENYKTQQKFENILKFNDLKGPEDE